MNLLPVHKSFFRYLRFPIVLLMLVLAFQIFFRVSPVQAVVMTWDGGGVTNDWSEDANWSGDVEPGASDIATFDGTSTKDATIDTAISVAGIDINSGYTGTITQGAGSTVTVGSSNYDQAAGAFAGGSDSITLSGTFTLSGSASFTSTSGTFATSSNWTDTSSTATFSHNNGTVSFNPSAATRTFNIATTETFYNVTISATSATNTLSVSTGDTMIVSNTLTLTNGQLGGSGKIRVDGTLSHAAGFDGGTGTVEINAALALTPAAGLIYPGITLTDAGSSFTGPGSGTVVFEGPISIGPGTFDAGAGTIQFEQNFIVVTSGTFSHGGGTMLSAPTSGTVSMDVDGTETFNHFTINSSTATNAVQVWDGDTVDVDGTLTLTNGELDDTDDAGVGVGVLNANTAISVAAGFDGGTGSVTLNIPTALAPAAGQVYPGFIFTDAGSSFTGPGSGTVTFEGGVNVDNGTFTTGAGTISFSDYLVVEVSGSLVTGTGTVVFGGSTTSGNTWDVDGTQTFNDFTINGTGSIEVASGDTLDVDGLLTLTNGELDGPNGILAQNGTFSRASTFDGGNGVVQFNTLQNITFADNDVMSGMHLTVAGSSLTGPVAGSDYTIEGTVLLDAGTTMDAGAGSLMFQSGIDISAGGTFNHDSGTIVLLDTDIFFAGDLTFNDVASSTNDFVDDFTIEFDDASTVTIEGDISIQPESSNPPMIISLISDNPGTQATIDVQDTLPAIGYVDVSDIENIGPTIICVVYCTDSGNNTGWYFGQAGVLVSEVSGNTDEAGGTATFDVELRNEPLDDVTIPVSSSDTTEGTVSTATLTFTSVNWDTPQTVTVTGVDDAANDGGVTYTIELGPADSVGDTYYDGLEVADIELVNEDDDGPEDGNGMDFEDPLAFSYENIAEQLGIAWFELDFYGLGHLMTGEFGTEVDLTGTPVRGGCRIVIDGTEWIINAVWPDQTTEPGYINVTDDPTSNPFDIEAVLTASAGDVTSITCSQAGPDGMALTSDDIVAVRASADAALDSSSYVMIYDEVDNTLWLDAEVGVSGEAVRLDLTDLSVDTFAREDGNSPKIGFDPTRRKVWHTNDSSTSVTKFDMATGAATTYPIEENCEAAEYDPTNDRMWILCAMTSGTADSLLNVDPVDGSVDQTIALEADNSTGTHTTYGIVYDQVNDLVWSVVDNGLTIVAVDASTGGYAFGTLADSTFSTLHSGEAFWNFKTPLYVEETNTIWVMDPQCNSTRDTVTILDASTGIVVGGFDLPECPLVAVIDETEGIVWFSSSYDGLLTEVRLTDNTIVEEHLQPAYGHPIGLDAENDIWITLCCGIPGIFEYVRNGVPIDDYYTAISNDSAQIDTTTWESIDSIAVNEDTDGQSIFYAVSFDDRQTFVVNGSRRAIASDDSAEHGGVDGDWYYRDNADSWTATPSNTSEESVSLAIAAGANNQMDGTEMAALTSGDWETLGFDAGSTTTLDISTTMLSNDAHDAPSVQSIEFTVAGGGGGGGGGGDDTTFVENPDIEIQDSASCTPDRDVALTLYAENADDMQVSNLPDLSDATWEPYNTSRTWTLSEGDGEKTVYARYRSVDGNISIIVSDSIILDTANICEDIPEIPSEDEIPPDEPTETPTEPELPGGTDPGDSIRTDDNPTVYFVTEEGGLRPFNDLQTFLTYADSCRAVKFVENNVVQEFEIGLPMMPNPGTTMVVLPESSNVYWIEEHPTDPDLVILRHIVYEQTVIEAYGEHWADYVISITPDAGTYEIGDPINTAEEAPSGENLRSRSSLNGHVRYELYIVNPDGERRFASDWAHIEPNDDGTTLFQFEDKTDNDYNDVVMRVDTRQCLSFSFSVLPLEAAYHHKIGVQIFFNGSLQDDVIISADSHRSVGEVTIVNVTNVDAFSPYEVLTPNEAEDEGFRVSSLLTLPIRLMQNLFAR